MTGPQAPNAVAQRNPAAAVILPIVLIDDPPDPRHESLWTWPDAVERRKKFALTRIRG
jgi:hypothetical protein